MKKKNFGRAETNMGDPGKEGGGESEVADNPQATTPCPPEGTNHTEGYDLHRLGSELETSVSISAVNEKHYLGTPGKRDPKEQERVFRTKSLKSKWDSDENTLDCTHGGCTEKEVETGQIQKSIRWARDTELG